MHRTTTPQPRVSTWPLWLLALPAGVAIWAGWVGLGQMAGFGEVNLLPGISDLTVNTAVTLPIGMEAYAAFALRVWLTPGIPSKVVQFAKKSALAALALGAVGQVFYHLMSAAGVNRAPWVVTVFVSTLPVAVLGMGAALAHLLTHTPPDETSVVEAGPLEGNAAHDSGSRPSGVVSEGTRETEEAVATATSAGDVDSAENGANDAPRSPADNLDMTAPAPSDGDEPVVEPPFPDPAAEPQPSVATTWQQRAFTERPWWVEEAPDDDPWQDVTGAEHTTLASA